MKSITKLFLSLIFVCFIIGSINGQKFEFGLGLGINHSKIDEDIRTQVGPIDDFYKTSRLPALNARIGYKFNDRFHLNSGFGFSWLGALTKDQSERIIASTFEIPLQLEVNVYKGFSLASGIIYNHIMEISAENEPMSVNLIPSIYTKNQVAVKQSIAYSIKQLEISLNYAHYLTDLFQLTLTDSNGNSIGSLVSKFRNIQLGVLFTI